MQSDLAPFKLWLAQNNRKQGTIYRHCNIVKLIENKGYTLTRSGIDAFLVHLKETNHRHSYLNHVISTASCWGQCFGIEELQGWKRFKKEPFAKATMSDEEIEVFLSLPCRSYTVPHSKTGTLVTRFTNQKVYRKMKMFWEICAYTGMRTGEVAHLTVDRVDFGRGVFVLEETKTGHPRYVPIPPNIDLDLKGYVTEVQGDYLFPSSRGGNHNGTGSVVDNVDWHYDFHKRIKELGIKRKNLTPYSLRHSLITRLLEEDVNIFKVQKIVGHSDIKTTAQYTHLTTKDIKEAISKHPLIRRATDPRAILTALVEAFTRLFDKDDRFEKDIEIHDDEIVIRVKIKK